MPTRFTIEETSWREAASSLSLVREKVFIAEQRIPRRVELDGRDSESLHVIARLEDDTIIGTGRMLASGHIGHIAVLMPYRRMGVGKALLDKLVELAKSRGLTGVYLDCELESVSFYESQQFQTEGPVFMESGIPHQRMTRSLKTPGLVPPPLQSLASQHVG